MQAALHEGAALSEKIKLLERAYSLVLPAAKPYVARLDGVSFKRFTSGMAKPFDPRFTRAMMLTTRDLLEKSAARTAFCQSDEITLVFGSEEEQTTMYYGGRVSKIETVLASMASARFNFHLCKLTNEDWAHGPPVKNSDQVIELVTSGNAFFDARVFSVPDTMTAMESIYWRHKHDCRRNVVNTVGFHILGHKKMNNMSMGQVLEMLRSEFSIDPFRIYPPEAMFGVFFKKIQYQGMGYNPVTSENVPCIRNRVEARTFDWEGTAEDRSKMVLEKFWTPSDPQSTHSIDL